MLGTPGAEVVAVESLELPASATSLDTLLRLRRPDGGEYLHLIEWQGYRDPQFLWRTLSYLAWLGQHRPERPVLATIVYLRPGDDVGQTLQQGTLGQAGWSVSLSCVRLWEVEAARALAAGTPGLAALSPLMAGATAELVERAAAILLSQTAPPVQDELLTVLGIFAEGFVATAHLERLVSRERIMSSTFIRRIFEEELAEIEAEAQRREAALLWELQRMAVETVSVRFPKLPTRLSMKVLGLADPTALRTLHTAPLRAADQAEAERILAGIGGE